MNQCVCKLLRIYYESLQKPQPQFTFLLICTSIDKEVKRTYPLLKFKKIIYNKIYYIYQNLNQIHSDKFIKTRSTPVIYKLPDNFFFIPSAMYHGVTTIKCPS